MRFTGTSRRRAAGTTSYVVRAAELICGGPGLEWPRRWPGRLKVGIVETAPGKIRSSRARQLVRYYSRVGDDQTALDRQPRRPTRARTDSERGSLAPAFGATRNSLLLAPVQC